MFSEVAEYSHLQLCPLRVCQKRFLTLRPRAFSAGADDNYIISQAHFGIVLLAVARTYLPYLLSRNVHSIYPL